MDTTFKRPNELWEAIQWGYFGKQFLMYIITFTLLKAFQKQRI